MTGRLAAACLALVVLTQYTPAGFLRPAKPDDPLVYGVAGGIVVVLHPAALDARRSGGPRGLLRVGYQESGKFYLINYIAVEPLVGRALGLSELERGGDGKPGKRFTVEGDPRGRVDRGIDGNTLTLTVQVEPFANGARPVVEITLFERQPNRLRFRTRSAAGGADMRRCTLTATMGNQSRCRHLWLRDRAVFAPALYTGYAGTDFVEKEPFGLAELLRTQAGDAVAVISPDEVEPREVWPLRGNVWHHPGRWMAQYWLKPTGTFDDTLRCRVNGRRTYWGGAAPIPGGLSFENFELREPFRDGQEVWFGYTTDNPAKVFGFGYDVAPAAVRRQVPPAEVTVTPADGLTTWHPDGNRRFQRFTVPAGAKDLLLRLAGGPQSSIALWHGDRLHRRMTGRDGDEPFRVRWDVSSLRGQVVTLELVGDGLRLDGMALEPEM